MSDKKEIVSASPKVRKLAREFGADIYQIQGSQREGRVSEEDVKSFIKDSISEKIEKKQKIKTRKFSFFKGMMIVLIADLGMSLKNVSVIMAAAREYHLLLFFGLILSIFFLATMATYIPLWLKKYKWIGWLGLFAVLITATELTVGSIEAQYPGTLGSPFEWFPDINSIFKSWIYSY